MQNSVKQYQTLQKTLLFTFTRCRQDDFRIGGAIFGVGQELQRPGLSTPHCRGSRHKNKLGNNWKYFSC